MSAIGTKRTSPSALHMSAFDPKRTGVRSRPSASSKSGGWNHHLQCTRPQPSRQQLRPPPQPGPAPQPGPQPGPQPPPPRQRTRPQRSRQQFRPHCTSVKLSRPTVAAAGTGRIGAAWVVPDPPAKIRPAIPIANTVRNICVSPLMRASSWPARTTGSTKNKTSRSMNGRSARNKTGATPASRSVRYWHLADIG